MKKGFLWRVAAALMAAVVSVGLMSCGGNDAVQEPTPGPGPGPEPTISLVGTWKWEVGNGNYNLLTFRQDGTGDDIIVKNGHTHSFPFSYTYSDGVVTMHYSNEYAPGDGSFRVMSLTSTKLVLEGWGDDGEDVIFIKQEDTPPVTISLVGTWTGLLGDEGYYTCTFTGNETNGTLKVEINEKGNLEVESFSYTYTGGYLVLSGNNFSKTVQVISLTATTLVLKDFPDDGICTMTKGNGQQNSSLVGTWKWGVGNGNYNLLTFRQDGTGDDIIVKNGHTDSFPFTYTYSDGVVTMHYSNEYGPGYVESFRVMSLTSTTLILSEWEDGEDATFIRQQ